MAFDAQRLEAGRGEAALAPARLVDRLTGVVCRGWNWMLFHAAGTASETCRNPVNGMAIDR